VFFFSSGTASTGKSPSVPCVKAEEEKGFLKDLINLCFVKVSLEKF